MKKRLDYPIISLLFSVFVFSVVSGAIPADSLLNQRDLNPAPYRAGETLIYRVKIRGFPAGKWEMRVLDDTVVDGHPVYHFASKASTRGLFRLYRFEDSQQSYVDKSSGTPLRYEKSLIDRSYRAQMRVLFQHDQGRAEQVYNGRASQIEIPSGVQDELSMVYLLRRKHLDMGTRYEFDLLTLKRIFHVMIQVIRRERVKTILGKRETLVLRSTHGYQIWLTNDVQRIPVRIEAQTRLGKLTGELVAIQ